MKKILLVMFILLLSIWSVFGQEWVMKDNSTEFKLINVMLEDGKFMWIGTQGKGLCRLNKNSGEKVFYTTSNTDIPSNTIQCLAKDSARTLWIGTAAGIAHFDRNFAWDIYTSELPNLSVKSINIDDNGRVWVGTQSGLSRFDGVSTWDSLGLNGDNVTSIIFDPTQSSVVWIGTFGGGLVKYDGTMFIRFRKAETSLPDDRITSMDIDSSGILWIGTNNGLASFNRTGLWDVFTTPIPFSYVTSVIAYGSDIWVGTMMHGVARRSSESWTIFNKDNSEILSNFVKAITVDSIGCKWIGCSMGGLNIYKEGGVPAIKTQKISKTFGNSAYITGSQIFYSSKATLEFYVPTEQNVNLKIYECSGKEVVTLLNKNVDRGFNQVTFDKSKLSNGVYYCRMLAGNKTVSKRMLFVQ